MSDSDSEDDLCEVKPYTEIDDGKRKFYHTCLDWEISEYSFKTCSADEELLSPEFRCSDAGWLLYVYPNGRRKNDSVGRVEIQLKKTHSLTYEHSVVSEITIARKSRYENICKIKHTFEGNNSSCIFPSEVLRSHVLRKKNGYLRNECCVINCNIFVFGKESPDVTSTSTKSNIKEPEKKEVGTNTLLPIFQPLLPHCDSPAEKEGDLDGLSKDSESSTESKLFLPKDLHIKAQDDVTTLSNDFEALHDNPRFADVILKVGAHEFLAHKLVLRSRSKVFEAMFDHDMQENRQDTVDLVKMEALTVKDLLRYIYCGKMRQLPPEDALRLYVAADRYDLQGLVCKCREIMLSSLSVDNICEISVVADLHEDQLLKNAAKSFLSKDMKEVLETEKWKVFSKENPILSLNLIQSAILKN